MHMKAIIEVNRRGSIFDTATRQLSAARQGQVPDFHDPHRLASVFEVRVGSGRLLVCGLNIAAEDLAGRAMQASLLDYAASADFHPQTDVSVDWLNRLLRPATPPERGEPPR